MGSLPLQTCSRIPPRALFFVFVMVASILWLTPAAACVLAEQVSLDDVLGRVPVEVPARSYVGLVEREVVRVWPQTVERTAGSLAVATRVWSIGTGSVNQEPRYEGGAYRGGPSTTNSCGSGLPTGAPMGDRTYHAVFETSSGSLATIQVKDKALTVDYEALLAARFGPPIVLDRPQAPDDFPYGSIRSPAVPGTSHRPSVWLIVGVGAGATSLLLLLLAAFQQRKARESELT